MSVYNQILQRRPDLARLLAGPWFFDRKGEVPAGKKGFFEIPVFNFYKVGMRPCFPCKRAEHSTCFSESSELVYAFCGRL